MIKQLITILIPCYNEEDVLDIFYEKTTSIINKIERYNFEILFINDGSSDNSLEIIKKIYKKDKRIRYVDLSRNYGKEIAMAAGFDYTKGDALIIIDADLQDPPELIPLMIEKWEAGYDDIYAQRISRKGETWLKKWTAKKFYKILAKTSKIEIQKDTGDFRMLSSKAINSIKQFKESQRYTKGLFSLIGHKKIAIPYHRESRVAGNTKWNYFKLFNLAIEGITSFTTSPLKIATIMGIGFALFSFIYIVYIITKTILYGDPVQGYPSMISIMLLLGGIQLICLGAIGEYLGRTFLETKNRPLYFINETE